VSAHGARALELAGRVADGVLSGYGVLPETRARATELVRKGAIDAGRDPESVEIWDVVVVSPGQTVEEGFLHSGMAGAFMLARHGFTGKLVPPELQAAIREMAATYSLDTHSRANEASLEVARRTGCMEYLIERIGGMIGPVDLTQGVQKLEQRGVRNLLFVGIGQDKRKVIQTLAKDVVGRRGGSGRSHERSAPMPSS